MTSEENIVIKEDKDKIIETLYEQLIKKNEQIDELHERNDVLVRTMLRNQDYHSNSNSIKK